MLTVEEARIQVSQHSRPLPPARRSLSGALGCILAEDIAADLDLPPFDKALVDGYAVRSADLDGGPPFRLRLGEEIPAGTTPTRPLAVGEAATIMTGAPLPEGADAVVMIEQTRREGDSVVIETAVRSGQNRMLRGRELKTGDIVLTRGMKLNAACMGVLAAVGRTTVEVIPRSRIVIVPTGDELVEPDRMPGPGQVRNSNTFMLQALCQQTGAEAVVTSIAPDEPGPLRERLQTGLDQDVLIITGGVSAGGRDLVPATLTGLGVSTIFHKIRLKPGKPLLFGVGPARADGRPGTLVFGLPGNPVSGLVGFVLFVRPALAILRGFSEIERPSSGMNLRLFQPFSHRGDRPTYYPARLVPNPGQPPSVEPLDWAGSPDLRTVTCADGFAVFPAGDHDYSAGEVIEFVPLD